MIVLWQSFSLRPLPTSYSWQGQCLLLHSFFEVTINMFISRPWLSHWSVVFVFFPFQTLAWTLKYTQVPNGGERQRLNGAHLLFRLRSSMFNYLFCKYGTRIVVNMGKTWQILEQVLTEAQWQNPSMKWFCRTVAEKYFSAFGFCFVVIVVLVFCFVCLGCFFLSSCGAQAMLMWSVKPLGLI